MFRDEGEQQSERSDAGAMIVPEVFAMVKGGCREDEVRSAAEEPWAGIWGAGEGGGSPFIPCLSLA